MPGQVGVCGPSVNPGSSMRVAQLIARSRQTSFLEANLNSINLTMGALAVLTLTARGQSENWQDQAISPVGNPIYFEDPRITTEARPIFMEHWLPYTFHFSGGSVPLGGGVR